MDPRERSGLDGLGEDLVLLSVSPADGRISTRQRIGFGLMGSELVRLAASGRITIAGNRVLVQDHSPCGDAELDAALASLAGPRRGVRPKTWVSHPRRGICDAYLARLAAAGAVRAERGVRLGIFPVTRWHVTDTARLSEARARLDAIALSTGPADTAQTAYAGADPGRSVQPGGPGHADSPAAVQARRRVRFPLDVNRRRAIRAR
jgi:hypothetical protein